MALAAVQVAMNVEEKRNIHPFFSKPHKNNPLEQPPQAIEASADNAHDDPDYEQVEKAQRGQKKRTRKSSSASKKNDSPGVAGQNQSLIEKFTKPQRDPVAAEEAPGNAGLLPSKTTLEEDPNQDRRKRMKTNSPEPARADAMLGDAPVAEPLDWHQQLELEAGHATALGPADTASKSTSKDIADNMPVNGGAENKHLAQPRDDTIEAPARETTPDLIPIRTTSEATPKKKTLKINKNGKLLSSPPKADSKAEPESTPPKKRRGRQPKQKIAPTITIIKYGHDTASRRAIGEKIEAIFRGQKTATLPVTPKKAPPKPSGPPKPTHPFFMGNAALKNDQAAIKKQSPVKTVNLSRVSPRIQKHSAVIFGQPKTANHGASSSFGMPVFGAVGSVRTSKESGLAEAPWPTKEMTHVRNLDINVPSGTSAVSNGYSLKVQKRKGHAIGVSKQEDLIANLASQLRSSHQDQCNLAQSDFAPPQDVRLPTRLLTTGVDIQEQVRSQIMSLSTPREHATRATCNHPAVKTLFADIENTLTPFDIGKCEALAWAQKYSPKCVSHVLQLGEESAVLKDWLQNLTIMAVHKELNGSKNPGVPASKKSPPKKKRKRIEDDFIVDSDEEEEEEMVELPMEQSEYGDRIFSTTPSLRQPRWTRNRNFVLISGPHGCGKSTMVYAVAKELGFEIFEFNSGSRRSGKDIQARIGDMLENHHVNQKRNESVTDSEPIPTDDTDTERLDNALQKDLDSGRQGTMMSFFIAKAPAKEKPKSNPKSKTRTSEPRKASFSSQATMLNAQAQRKSQKQSLILFEEADVLYDEDQGFWAQVTRLASSKRPVIITCTDETLIPTHELPLAAILRIQSPPIDLAADYMLAMAGREGHLLDRVAVSTLYQSRNCDLRASITELNLWCQMSVGDRKGGLEWIYQRWPPGKDVDENGRLLRVASQGTYLPGMGCLSHNVFETKENVAFDRTEELLRDAGEEWGIAPYDWSGSQNVGSVPETSSSSTLDDLKSLDALTGSVSAADMYCSVDMPSYRSDLEQRLNPSIPVLSDKALLNYTVAASVIQADHVTDFSYFDRDMLTYSHLLIQRAYGGRQTSDVEESIPIPDTEEGFIDAILAHKKRQNHTSYLCRADFSHALDILAYPADTHPTLNTSYNLTSSSFDRTFRIIAEDLAPYVRSIVAHELVLENRRIRLGNLLSEGGGRNKRQRTTRAARTALEGGSRHTKRRERWFDRDLNRVAVMGTAGKKWAGQGHGAEEETETRTEGSTPGTGEE